MNLGLEYYMGKVCKWVTTLAIMLLAVIMFAGLAFGQAGQNRQAKPSGPAVVILPFQVNGSMYTAIDLLDSRLQDHLVLSHQQVIAL